MEDIVPGVLGHHERIDGKGYPQGLKGDEISLVARIVSLADAFDAMTSKRPYKKPWSPDRAAEEIKAESGTCFDPNLAEHFLKILPQIKETYEEYKE